MVPSATRFTVQPMCVQIAEKALKSPLDGWVTTTFCALNTLPPPSGISLVVARACPPAGGDEGDWAGEVGEGDCDEEALLPPQAAQPSASAAAAPVPSTVRRVVSG